MNILPVVLSMIVILALSSGLIWKDQYFSKKEHAIFQGFLQTQRQMESQYQDTLFEHAQEKPKSSTKSPAPKRKKRAKNPKKTRAFISRREQCPPHPYSMLYLELLANPNIEPLLSTIFLRLLDELYGHLPWYTTAKDQGLCKEIVHVLCELEKTKENGHVGFEKALERTDGNLRTFLYRMLQGTQDYTLESKQGVPPLPDFVCLSAAPNRKSSNAKKTRATSDLVAGLSGQTQGSHFAFFHFASWPLIRALFGMQKGAEIKAQEEALWHVHHRHRCIPDKDLLTLLAVPDEATLSPTKLQQYLQIRTKQIPRNTRMRGKDQKTGIVLRRDAPEA